MADPMRILVMDTATRKSVVAAVLGHDLAAQRAHEHPTSHAEHLFEMVEQVLKEAGWESSEVELLAVGIGPGSFTGVRVGMAAAKGIGFSLSIPTIGVCSLEAMAHAARKVVGAKPVAALLDAKKEEVFAACYDEEGKLFFGPEHVPRLRVGAWLDKAGAQVEVTGEVAQHLGFDTGKCASNPECNLPGPLSIATLAWERWLITKTDEIDGLEPIYVRPPDITQPPLPFAMKSTKQADST